METGAPRRLSPWHLVLATVVSLVPLAFAFRAGAPDPSGSTCGGIGFGMTPCGWDAVQFFYMFIGIPYVGGLILLVGLLEVTGRRGHPVRMAVAALGLAIPWLAGLLSLAGPR